MIALKRLGVEDLSEETVKEIQNLVRVLTDREVVITLEGLITAMEFCIIEVAIADEADGGSEGGMIVGMASLIPVVTIMGQHGIVEDVAVLPTMQGKNIGGMLIAALKAHAKQFQLTWLELTSRPSREAAQRLYAKMGFAQRETNVWRWTA